MPDLTDLTLTQTMLHELPRGRQKDDDDSGIVYSAQPTSLNDRTDRFIRDELLVPYLPTGREIVDAGSNQSPVPQLARDIFGDPELLGPHSKTLADWMHKKQGGGSSGGVFIASLASSGGQDRLVILKAEHSEGVRLQHSGVGDEIVFQVEHLTELIMGSNSRVYKIGVLWIDPISDKLIGVMVDKQNGAGYADFFLNDFLGCALTQQAEILTKKFVEGISKFLNSPLLTEDTKLRYAGAVVAVLESPAKRLNPNSFITAFIDPADRDTASEFLGADVANAEFTKNTTLVASQIGGLRMETLTGVVMTASSSALQDGTITLDPDHSGGPRTIVKGVPEGFKLARTPKK